MLILRQNWNRVMSSTQSPIIFGLCGGTVLSILFNVFGLFSSVGINYLMLAAEIVALVFGLFKINSGFLKRFIVSFLLALAFFTLVVGGIVSKTPSPTESAVPSNSPIPSAIDTPEPVESEPPDMTPDPHEMTERQTFASVDQIEDELASKNSYVPQLSDEVETYLFIDSQTSLHRDEDTPLTDSELFELVRERFYTAHHSVQNFSAAKVNSNPELSNLILNGERLDELIKQAIATNRISDLPVYYDDLIEIYSRATTEAPRGEYFLQLGRPYYEKALYMRRETSKEKNEVFYLCAYAINAYRTSSTYEGTSGETDADLLYRIAAAYHYLGDTPAISSSYRVRLYRLAVAYLSLADALSSVEDDYYGYISYYKGMVLHKIAIVTTDSLDSNNYLTSAMDFYSLASSQRTFNESLLADLDHARRDIEYRLS